MTERAVEAARKKMRAAFRQIVTPPESWQWADAMATAAFAVLHEEGWRPPAQPASEREREIRLWTDYLAAPHTPRELYTGAVKEALRDLLTLLDAERAAVAQARREARAQALEEAETVCRADMRPGAADLIRALAKEPPHDR